MTRTIEAVIDESGRVHLLESVKLPTARRARVIIFDEVATVPQSTRTNNHDWTRFYHPIKLIGRGGMGETYQAEDKLTGKIVCVKQLLPFVNHPALSRALSQECRALARLNHPSIVQLLNFDLSEQSPYLVMEFIHGPTLAHYIRQHQLIGEPLVVSLSHQLFKAIDYAHKHHIIHCDLKPSNILLERQGSKLLPKILDFGLAVVDRRDDLGELTAIGRQAGTPAYMAPEQFQGTMLSGACDIYALGLIMWEMLMGRFAFLSHRQNFIALIYAKSQSTSGLEISDPPLQVSKPLSQLISQCTDPDPKKRPTAAQALKVLKQLDTDISHSSIVLAPVNMGFDLPLKPNYQITGWGNGVGFVEGVSPAYEFRIKSYSDGVDGASVRIRDLGAGSHEFGSLMQRCPAHYLCGKAIRLEGQLRTARVQQWAGLWLRVDGENKILIFDNMHNRPVRGSTSWQTYAINAHVPQGAKWINYGILLVGHGVVWANNLQLLVKKTDGSWISLSL